MSVRRGALPGERGAGARERLPLPQLPAAHRQRLRHRRVLQGRRRAVPAGRAQDLRIPLGRIRALAAHAVLRELRHDADLDCRSARRPARHRRRLVRPSRLAEDRPPRLDALEAEVVRVPAGRAGIREGRAAAAREAVSPLAFSIASRFRGPRRSGNGGYVAGALARYLSGAVAVRLKAPPPLETTLAIALEGDGARLLHGSTVVAEARAARLELEAPPAPAFQDAEQAAKSYSGFERHPLPE